jgi:hypothetical protein
MRLRNEVEILPMPIVLSQFVPVRALA